MAGEIINDENLYFSENKEESLKDHRWAHCSAFSHMVPTLCSIRTSKAGHLPGSVNQDTICVNKASSDSKTPWYIGGKKSATDTAGD